MRGEEIGDSGLTLDEICAELDADTSIPQFGMFPRMLSVIDIMGDFDLDIDDAERVLAAWRARNRERYA